jgi:predicted N-acetyltransferase YhbS
LSADETIANLLSTKSTLRTVGRYVITDDPTRIEIDVVFRYLSRESYWRQGISRERVERAMRMSLCLAAIAAGDQSPTVGFIRVVTDTATHAWLDDLFVLPEHRGHGLGRALVGAALEHPAVADSSMQLLLTADAHPLYARDGFALFPRPDHFMARWSQ